MKAVYKNLLALGLLFMIAVRIESPRTYSKPKIKVHEKIAVKIERLRTLAKLSNRDYLIRLDKKGYRHLIKDPPRNYSVVVFFTDFDNPENLLVKAASKDLRNVIISYCHKHFHSNRLFFAEAHGPEFGKVLMKDLGVREYPILVNFPPRGDPGVFSLTKNPFNPASLAEWIEKETGVFIDLINPPSSSALSVPVLCIFAFILFLVWLWDGNIESVLNSTNAGIFLMFFSVAMMAGTMFNVINKPPFFKVDGDGLTHIHPHKDQQLSGETYVVMFLGGVLVTSVFLIIEAADRHSDIHSMASQRMWCSIGMSLFSSSAFALSSLVSMKGYSLLDLINRAIDR